MRTITPLKAVAACAITALIAIGVTVAFTASAAPSKRHANFQTMPRFSGMHHGFPPLGLMRAGLGMLRSTVHADLTIVNADGTAGTITADRGSIESVAGDQLTLKQGTPKTTLKTLTLTIPGNATVLVNFSTKTLADLKPGQRAVVATTPKGTYVLAFDASSFDGRFGP
jgi:hypothetical protein